MSNMFELMLKEDIDETDYNSMIRKLKEITEYDCIIDIPNFKLHEVSILSEILLKDANHRLLLDFPTNLLKELNELFYEETEYIIADVDCDIFFYGQLENRNYVDSLKKLLLKIKKEN